jgi:hypothetical protein
MMRLIRGMIIIFIFGLPTTCLSQNEEKIKYAHQIIQSVLDREAHKETTRDALRKYFEQQYMRIAGSAMDEVSEPLEVELRIKILEYLEKNLNEITKNMVGENAFYNEFEIAGTYFYAEHFSIDELREIVIFFNSPAGKKLKLMTPKMKNILAPLMGKWFEIWTEQLRQEVKNLIEKGPPNNSK